MAAQGIRETGNSGRDQEMKTRYKFIHFKLIRTCTKTTVWGIYNNRSGASLGGIAYYPSWREYCQYGQTGSIFNIECLDNVKDFIKQLEEARSNGKR